MAVCSCDCLFVFCLVSLVLALAAGEAQEDQFFVKPGAGTKTFELTSGSFTCSFTYIAQGGTHETWGMAISPSSDGKEWSCVVERPGGSYLFFEEFKMQLVGAKIKEVVLESEPGRLLSESEYVIDEADNHVKQGGNFGSKLCHLKAVGMTGKSEL